MSEQNPTIKVQLSHSIKINYTMCATGEKGSVISTNGKLLMAIGRLYEIPIDFNGNLDNFHVVKMIGEFAEKFEIRNIRDGLAVIQPIIHNVLIKNEEEIASLL